MQLEDRKWLLCWQWTSWPLWYVSDSCLSAETRKYDNPHALCLPTSSAVLRIKVFPATHAVGMALILKTAEEFGKHRA